MTKPTALIIDHDDSFTHNVRVWLSVRFDVEVIHHLNIFEIASKKKQFDLIVLSPGPKSAQDYPHCLLFLAEISDSQHVLGICLGMQLMTLSTGGHVATYAPPLHGKTSILESENLSLHGSIVARYHSMYCILPTDHFLVVATSEAKPMWFQHLTKKWMGFQFHPESFMTTKPELYLDAVYNWISK